MNKNKTHKFLDLAARLGREYKYDAGLEYHLCAILVRGGKVLSIGYNNRQTHPLITHYRTKEHVCTVHAEIDAILNARKRMRLEGAKLYVARVRPSNGSVGLGKPCEMCQHVIYNYGLKRVYYTIDDHTYGVMKVHNPAENE